MTISSGPAADIYLFARGRQRHDLRVGLWRGRNRYPSFGEGIAPGGQNLRTEEGAIIWFSASMVRADAVTPYGDNGKPDRARGLQRRYGLNQTDFIACMRNPDGPDDILIESHGADLIEGLEERSPCGDSPVTTPWLAVRETINPGREWVRSVGRQWRNDVHFVGDVDGYAGRCR